MYLWNLWMLPIILYPQAGGLDEEDVDELVLQYRIEGESEELYS